MEASYITSGGDRFRAHFGNGSDITRELYKVVTLMGKAGRQVADYFRQADDARPWSCIRTFWR
jgi:hypothetical protein